MRRPLAAGLLAVMVTGCDGLPDRLRPDDLPGVSTPAVGRTPAASAPTVVATLTVVVDEAATIALPSSETTASGTRWASADEALADVDLARGVVVGKAPGVTRLARSGADGEPGQGVLAVEVSPAPAATATTPPGPGVLRPHSGPVRAVLALPGGRLASGGGDGVVALSMPGTGLVSSLRGHRGPVLALAATADGERLVSASQDRTVRVWEVATGRLLRTLEGATAPVRGVAVDGATREVAAAGSDGQLRRWHLDTGASLGDPTPAGAPVWSLALGGRPLRLAAGLSDGRVLIFPWPPHGAAREAWRADAAVTSVAWAARDARLWAGALAVQAQGQGAAAPAAWRGDGRLVRALAVAPDGTRVARVTAGGSVDLLTPDGATAPRRLATGPAPVTAITFAVHELATGHADGTLRVVGGALDP